MPRYPQRYPQRTRRSRMLVVEVQPVEPAAVQDPHAVGDSLRGEPAAFALRLPSVVVFLGDRRVPANAPRRPLPW
jgi:hypothetical protein